jgi:hypothetical protein
MNAVIDVNANSNAVAKSGSVQGVAATASASAKSTTRAGTVFSVTPGLFQLFQSNFDYQLARGMLAGAYGDGGAQSVSHTLRRDGLRTKI